MLTFDVPLHHRCRYPWLRCPRRWRWASSWAWCGLRPCLLARSWVRCEGPRLHACGTVLLPWRLLRSAALQLAHAASCPLPSLASQDPMLLSEIFNTSSARCWSSGGRPEWVRMGSLECRHKPAPMHQTCPAACHSCCPCPCTCTAYLPADTYNPVPGFMEGVPSSRGYKGGFARCGAGRRHS